MTANPSSQRIVEDLRVELYRRRISQEQLATATGLSQSMISRRLNGEVEPTLPEVEAIASAAGLEVFIEIRQRSEALAEGAA